MTNEEYLLDWYKNHIWARPKPSKICDGVGMFAIRDIPRYTSIYDSADRSVRSRVSWEKVKVLPRQIVKWIIDHQPHLGSKIVDLSSSFEWDSDCGDVYLYTSKGFNFGDLHWAALWMLENHSDDPNIDITINPLTGYKYTSNRDIKEGEELFENYNKSFEVFLELKRIFDKHYHITLKR